MITSKVLHLCITTMFLTLLGGCATTIPETDTTPPEIELLMVGPGIGTQRMSNPPQEEWTADRGLPFLSLQADTRYNFTLIVSDDGGVAGAYFPIPRNFEVIAINSENVTFTTTATKHQLARAGDEDAPRTSLVISGSFRTRIPAFPPPSNADPDVEIDAHSFSLFARGEDFGGRIGSIRNQRSLEVYTEVVE